jgi:hypothetical protein
VKLSGLVIVALLVVLLAWAVVKYRLASARQPDVWPFYVKRPLSVPEQVLYHRLVKALPDHIVLVQVQVSRVLGVTKGSNFHHWNNRVNRLSFDFVVCTKDASVLAAIELDDKSHELARRARADEKKARASAGANLRLIRWSVKTLPDEATIRLAIFSRDAAEPDRAVPAGKGERAGAMGS